MAKLVARGGGSGSSRAMAESESHLGEHLALAVGVAALGGAVYELTGHAQPIDATIFALIAGGALSGWAKARRKRASAG